MTAAFQTAFRKSARTKSLAPRLGSDNAAFARRIEGAHSMGKRATTLKGENFSPGENLSAKIPRDRELREEFARVIRLYPAKVLAEAADCSVDAVKCWKAKRSFPHGTHLMRLLPDFPAISAWHARKTGGLNNPQCQVEVFAEIEKILAEDTPRGRAARARYREIVERQQP